MGKRNTRAVSEGKFGIRIVGLSASLHQRARLAAVRRGVAVRAIYEAAVNEYLSKCEEAGER